ncbi:MAG TPA: hypothetical protein VH853_14465 [Polyangia bacterium]|jgi:hypothetical protein|nr:hypothetical protein [Polyangia bacterium]
MNHGLEIIPISSSYRRRPLPAGPRTHLAFLEERPGAGWGGALLVGWMLLIVAIAAHDWVQDIGSIRGLPPAERARIYQRSLAEAVAACTTPGARAGALHDHCRGQAEFLILFPECDGRCQRLVEAILPHARR